MLFFVVEGSAMFSDKVSWQRMQGAASVSASLPLPSPAGPQEAPVGPQTRPRHCQKGGSGGHALQLVSVTVLHPGLEGGLCWLPTQQ